MMNTEVKRYEPVSYDGNGECVESKDGEYVNVYDYAALDARLADTTEAHVFELAERMKHQAEAAETALAAARRDALEEAEKRLERDVSWSDAADAIRALIAQEQEPTT